ncbi:MAG TPA: hypothetical protein VFU93_12275 [Acidimicrobiales bacterium]|nr:hypothetical protein [Acidimicrobiales bacterium]
MPSSVSTDTTAVVHPNTDVGRSRIRHRRAASWLTGLVLFAVMASAAVDAIPGVDIWGVDDERLTATSASGAELVVRYPTVTRPALASPFEITVERPGGFENDVEIAIDVEYLELWDLNGIYPSPAEERSDGDRIIWTFDAPDGESFLVSYDARIEPGAQLEEREGAVSFLEPGEPELTIRFATKVRP